MNLTTYTYRNETFQGISEGGVQTCMVLPRFKLMFDVGRGASRVIEIPRLLLTHGHLDHSSGVPYYISQRNLRRLPPADVYCPPEMAEPLDQIMKLWSKIEDYNIEYNIHPLEYDRLYELQNNYYFQPVRSVHRVPSNGYTIIEKTRRLKPEFRELPGPEIARLKKERDDMFVEHHLPLITFSGDTQIEFVLENEIVRQSKVLFLECTFLDDARPVERARQWGHIHLDEIVANAECFRETEQLFLIHFSPRYRREVILDLIKAKLPDWLYERTTAYLTRGGEHAPRGRRPRPT